MSEDVSANNFWKRLEELQGCSNQTFQSSKRKIDRPNKKRAKFESSKRKFGSSKRKIDEDWPTSYKRKIDKDRQNQTAQVSNTKRVKFDEDSRFCHTCKVKLNNDEGALAHYAGKAHAQRKLAQRRTRQGPDDQPPPYSFPEMITMSIQSSQDGKMKHCEIFQFIEDHFPYYKKMGNDGKQWKGCIRQEMNANPMFIRLPHPVGTPSMETAGHFWILASNPEQLVISEEGLGDHEEPNGSVKGSKTLIWPCKACTADFSTLEAYTVHINSDEHKAKYAESANAFECKICKIFTSNEKSMSEHLKGKKHTKNLETMGLVNS